MQALKSNKGKPAPNHYTLEAQLMKVGGDLGHQERMGSDPSLRAKKDVPGPGSYKTKAT